ncbi:hypothetical protein OS190_13425 [Sulfitobacter sp. F26204]|uniref:hypothetical protein n=1 Tax=Sulfitobacter sp. F26204 TaxID=2996014 RepID=UPI00225DD206|nr:hypothetical protein [Sulfitobacter sp. F26204]MCX7560572.1 hypothetical protein [Sulfitobacter sp. F26204]
MTERTETMTQASAPAFHHEGSYIDWSSILAGTVVASAIAFVFTTFGTALGLALISPYEGEGSALAALIAVGTWMLWTTISSFMAGGYIAGRMRRRIDSASADEVSIRDGIHGLAVWGAAVLLGAFLLGSSADTAVQATTETATAVATVADTVTNESTQTATTTPEAPQVSEAEAKAATEMARKYSVISAFVLAAALMVAAAGAYWAAGMGGQHRDEKRVFARFGRWT